MMKSVNSYGLRYWLYQMGQLKTCTVFNIIFSLLAFPFLSIASSMLIASSEYDETAAPLMVVGIIGILGLCAMSYITPIITLRHLYTKVSADNILSLPLTGNQRYFADIAAMLTSYHLPFGISAVLSVITELIACDYLGIVKDVNDLNIIYIYAFKGLVLTLMFCALNTAVITCCGRITEAIIYPFVINVIIPVITACGILISYKNCVGVSGGSIEMALASRVMCLSPFGAIFYFIYYNDILPMLLIMTLLYFIAAFIGYKFRCAENIGKPFVFRYAYHIISGGTALALIMLYTCLSDYATISSNALISLPALGIILLILMLVMEVINYRKIKGIGKFAAKYGATLIGGVLLCAGLLASRGFGIGYYIPDTEDIESANIYFFYYDTEDGYNYNLGSINDVLTDAPVTIDLIRAEHQSIIDSYDEDNLGESTCSIRYRLKNGKYVDRYYYINGSSEGFWKSIYESEGYRTHGIASMKQSGFFTDMSEVKFRLINQHINKVYMEADISDLFESELLAALKEDLKNDTEFGRHDEYSVGVLQFGAYHERYSTNVGHYADTFISRKDFVIYESYTNTIECLSRYGVVPTAEESLEDSVKNCQVFTLLRRRVSSNNQSFNNVMFTDCSEMVMITAEEFRELAQNHVNYNNAEDDGYVYSVIRGMPSDMGAFKDYYDYAAALEELGIQYENSDFLDDGSIYTDDNYIDYRLNEEYNDIYAAFFENRTVFTNDTSILNW